MIKNPWFEKENLSAGVTRLNEPFVHKYFGANFFHVAGTEADLVIDFGMGLLPLRPELNLRAGVPVLALATHIHADHVGGFHEFETRLGHPAEAQAFASMADSETLAHIFRSLSGATTRDPEPGWKLADYKIAPAPLTSSVDEGHVIELGDWQLEVLHMPGHSHGSICLYESHKGILFSGDVIYVGGLVDDQPCSDKALYRRTMQRLLDLDVDTIYAGHGPTMDSSQMKAIASRYLDSD